MDATTQQPSPRDYPVLAYFGHHKCATTFIIRILRELCGLLGLVWHEAYLPEELPFGYHLEEPFRGRRLHILDKVARPEFDFLAHGNADQALVSTLGAHDFRGFHVIRDPRDIVVSGYFSHLKSHSVAPNHNPWLLDHRRNLQSLELEDGLICEIEFCEPYLRRIADWDYQDPRIHETTFEVLTQQPETTFRSILEFLGISVSETKLMSQARFLLRRAMRKSGIAGRRIAWVPAPTLDRIIESKSFKSSTGGRKRGSEDVESHYRKGISGDWENYFTPAVRSAFKERYGQMLIELGYASNLDW